MMEKFTHPYKVDLYIRRRKIMRYMPRWHMRDPYGAHRYGYTFPPEIRESTTKHVSKDEDAVLKLLKDFSKKNNLRLVMHDLGLWRERLKAWLKHKHIKRTPVILIGEQRIEGVPTREELENALATMKK